MRRNTFNRVRRFERLEDRRLMAADIDLNNGILSIEGTGNDDVIEIRVNPEDSEEVLVTIKNAITGQLIEDADYDRNEVDEIYVDALGGNDQVYNRLDVRAEMYGRGGGDFLISGNANDMLDGGADNDYLSAGGGDDELYGGGGSDTYRFGGPLLGSDVVYEDPSLDTDKLDFSSAQETGGVAVNLGITTTQVVVPGHLSLRFSSATGIENVMGTRFDDLIIGNSRDNSFLGYEGNDELYGRDGNDRLSGQQGDDYLYGEAGDDFLDGDENNDVIYGGAGNDVLLGDAGEDHLYGESGVDYLFGGADNDFLDGGIGRALGQAGRDQLDGGGGSDLFVRNRSVRSRYTIFEDLLDYASAVDEVMTIWY